MAGTESLPTPQDVNQNYAIVGVQGTAGTADTKGTSVTMPFSVDPSTGAAYVSVIQGGITSSRGTAFSTYGTTGVAVWGTLIAAAGAGTKQYVENLDIVVHSGTVDVAVTSIGTSGTTGVGVLARGMFGAGGGIQRNFYPPVASSANGTLAYWLGGAGTVSIDIVYWQGV